MKKIILGIVGILAILIIIFLLQAAPIDPAAYTPPKSQAFAGVLVPNNLLQKAELLALGKINGPEEVAVDSYGRVYGGTQDGKIMRLLPDGKLDTFAETKGRPLGIQFDKNKNSPNPKRPASAAREVVQTMAALKLVSSPSGDSL